MDTTLDEPCATASQEDPVTKEGSVDFQDNGTEESAQEEGEVIGYFELDPSAGLQLMQGENTIYLPPEALGEHVLMSEGGKGCQQIIVVVEEGTEDCVAGSSVEAPFDDKHESTFVGDSFDIQQHVSSGTHVQFEHAHQQVLLVQEQNGTVSGEHEDMTSLFDESSAHSHGDQGVLICPEGEAETPDKIVQSDIAMGSILETDSTDNTVEPPAIEERKGLTTAKDIGEYHLVNDSSCKTVLEAVKLTSDSNKQSLCGSPQLVVACSDAATFSGLPLLTEDTKVSVPFGSTASMQDFSSGNLPSASKCDVRDSDLKNSHERGLLMSAPDEDTTGDCQGSNTCIPVTASDDVCSKNEENNTALTSLEQECPQGQDSLVDTAQQRSTGDNNESSAVSTNYLSEQEELIPKSTYELHKDCSASIENIAEPDLSKLDTQAGKNVLSSSSYASTASPLVKNVQLLSDRDASSLPASVLRVQSECGNGTVEAEQREASSNTCNEPREFEVDTEYYTTKHDVDLGSKGISEAENIHRVPSVDNSSHETELAVEGDALLHHCSTLRDLAKEIIDKHSVLCITGENLTSFTPKHIEDTSNLHMMKMLPAKDVSCCEILPVGEKDEGNKTATKETSVLEDNANFILLNNRTDSLTCCNVTKYALDGPAHSDAAAREIDAHECVTSQDGSMSDDKSLHEENLPTSRIHGATKAEFSDVSHCTKIDAKNVPLDGEEHVSFSESGLPLTSGDALSTSQNEEECNDDDMEAETSAKVNDTHNSCKDEESGGIDSEHHLLFTDCAGTIQTDGVIDEGESAENKDSEMQQPSADVERTVGEELMAALELVPCQELSPTPAVDEPEGGEQQEPARNVVETATETLRKVKRRQKKKPEAPLENSEDPSPSQKRWCLRTPSKPRKRVIIPDSDEDDFDSYDTFDTPPQAQKSKAEEAFDALLNVFKIEQAQKAAEKETHQDSRKAGAESAKQRRGVRCRKDSTKQTTIFENSAPVTHSKAHTDIVDVPPATSASSKAIRNEKVPHKKSAATKKGAVTSRQHPLQKAPVGDIRIRCQRPAASPDKSAPQYHCSKCGFRSARMDNIVRHHKEECPHTKTYLRWGHDMLKKVTGLGSEHHSS